MNRNALSGCIVPATSLPRGAVAVALELAVKRLSLDAENPSRGGLVACHGLEHSQDVTALDLLHRY